jgi:hypothetical protein
MSYKIPMGPYHPALEEPYKLDMICEGETVATPSCISASTSAASSIWPKPATTFRSSRSWSACAASARTSTRSRFARQWSS